MSCSCSFIHQTRPSLTHSYYLHSFFCLSPSPFALHFFSYLFLMHLWISVQGKVNQRIGAVGCWEWCCLLWNKWQRESEVRNYTQLLLTFFKGCSGFKSSWFFFIVYSFMQSSLICKDNCKVDGCVYWCIISKSVVSGVLMCFHSHSAQSQFFSFNICCLHSLMGTRTLSWSHEPEMSCD